MHPDIERLLIVQEIDVEIRRLREDLARYPDWRKTHVAAIERERQRLADGEGRLLELEKRIRASDLALREARDRMRKLLSQQSRVKTQKEYDALTSEIQQTEAKIAQADDTGLEALAEQEAEQDRVKETRAALERKEQEHRGEMDRLAARERDRTDLLNLCVERRSQAAAQVSASALHRYGRLSSSFPGNCVVPVQEGNCAGCFMRVIACRLQELGRDDAINECDSCHRFLYLPRSAEGTPPAQGEGKAPAEPVSG
jgi:hypothetical protein